MYKSLLSLFFILLNASFTYANINNDLAKAVDESNYEMIEILINEGAEVNSFKNKKNLLYRAVKNNNTKLAELLLKNNAVIELDTALIASGEMLDAFAKYQDLNNLFFDVEDDRYSLLHAYIDDKNINMLLAGLKYINIEIKNAHGRTPLYFAVERNQPDTAKILIANGADANTVDYWNINILYYILFSQKNPAMFEYFITQGCDINFKFNGVSLLEYALLNRSWKIVDLLLYYDVNTNTPYINDLFDDSLDNMDPKTSILLTTYGYIPSCSQIADMLSFVVNEKNFITPVYYSIENGFDVNNRAHLKCPSGNSIYFTTYQYYRTGDKNYLDILEFMLTHGGSPYLIPIENVGKYYDANKQEILNLFQKYTKN